MPAAVIDERTADHLDEYLRAVEEDLDLGLLPGMARLMRRLIAAWRAAH